MSIAPSRRSLHRHRLKCVVLLACGVLTLHAIVLAWLQIDRQPDQSVVTPLVFHVSPAPTPRPEPVLTRHGPRKPAALATPRAVAHAHLTTTRQTAAAEPAATGVPVAAADLGPGLAEPTHANDGGNALAPHGPMASADTVEAPSSRAAYLSNPPPEYPAISRRLGEQGNVVIRVLIGRNGEAKQAEVHQSSGFYRLDQAALNTVMGWRYVPGRRAGVAQDMWFKVPLTFTLD